jgi:peptide-methionine (R)-S-oxide reductase
MSYEIEKSDDEWRQKLGVERFHILREAGTEAPWSGALLEVDGEGTFTCGGCGQVLFTTEQKFDSHCGWPSFDQCLPGTIIERPDHSLQRARTEILCSKCGGHLGHVFEDGPTSTGLRYCVNSLSIEYDQQS